MLAEINTSVKMIESDPPPVGMLYGLERVHGKYRAAFYVQTDENKFAPEWRQIHYLEWTKLDRSHKRFLAHETYSNGCVLKLYDLNAMIEECELADYDRTIADFLLGRQVGG